MFGVVLADTDSFVVTVFLQKESDMEWWKQIAEGEPDIDTSKVPHVKLLVGVIKLLVLARVSTAWAKVQALPQAWDAGDLSPPRCCRSDPRAAAPVLATHAHTLLSRA